MITLRLADRADVLFLYKLHTDPLARQFSKNTTPASWVEHVAWFNNHIHNIRIIVNENGPMGMILVTYSHMLGPDNIAWMVSINITPERRGTGVARAAMQFLMSHPAKCHLGSSFKVLLAEIHHKNGPSIKLFESLGFQKFCGTENPSFHLYSTSDGTQLGS